MDKEKEVSVQSEKTVDTAVFDLEGFLERIGGNAQFLRRLMLSFLRSAAEHLVHLGLAVERADAAEIRMQAHAIKGSAANIGAGRIRDLAESMETAAQLGDLAGMADWYAAAVSEFEKFKQETAEIVRDQEP